MLGKHDKETHSTFIQTSMQHISKSGTPIAAAVADVVFPRVDPDISLPSWYHHGGCGRGAGGGRDHTDLLRPAPLHHNMGTWYWRLAPHVAVEWLGLTPGNFTQPGISVSKV